MAVSLSSLTDAKVGDVLFFHYQGQGKPARNRFARVLESDVSENGPYVKANDLEIDAPRNFLASGASKIELVATPDQEVRPRDEVFNDIFKVPLNVDGQIVANLLMQLKPTEVEEATYYQKADAIVITPKKVEPTLEVETDDSGYTLKFTNAQSKALTLNFNGKDLLLAVADNKGQVIRQVSKPKVEDFVDELVKHFS